MDKWREGGNLSLSSVLSIFEMAGEVKRLDPMLVVFEANVTRTFDLQKWNTVRHEQDE